MHYSFPRYLNAKTSVDDRALNRVVWQTLHERVAQRERSPLRILEVGAGTGTMLQRLIRWGLPAAHIDYTGVDSFADNIAAATAHLPTWAAERGFTVKPAVGDVSSHQLQREEQTVTARFIAADAFTFLQEEDPRCDLLIANAFLDLVDLSRAFPLLFTHVVPGGLYYFTITFDGETIFQPPDPLDETVIGLYHASMDAREGGSQTGREIFHQLVKAGAVVEAAGGSDWVVLPLGGQYPADEAYFLHHILHFFEETLSGHPDLDAAAFTAWLDRRHTQVEAAELMYVAHQLDYVGHVPGSVLY